MTAAGRLTRWNLWYNELPEAWRFQFILWPLLALGAINLLLTISVRFPFALLVVLGILFMAVVRVPFALGWITQAADGVASTPRFEVIGAPWLIDLNRRYEAIPEPRRLWIYPTVLVIAGAINMTLTIAYGFPFGLLFLLVLLALVAIRAPYAAGWMASPSLEPTPQAYHGPITDQHPPVVAPTEAESLSGPDGPPPGTDEGSQHC